MPGLDVIQEANRQLIICNACRYCEGYCPVFRAIETRREFGERDVFYLSNLCHDCRACYYACMYTPPHEFAINIPKILAEARVESYRRWSWPRLLAEAFRTGSITVWLALCMAALVVGLGFALIPSVQLFAAHEGPGAFYAVVPYAVMVGGGLILFFYGIAIWLRGGAKSWAETDSANATQGSFKTFLAAVAAVLGLRYLEGGGPGCYYPDEKPSAIRRAYHQLTFWGFLSDFLSTTLALVYQDIFHRLPPYDWSSAPVIFGTIGGFALVIGTGGLIGLKWRSDRQPEEPRAKGMDYVFLVTLGLTALTGLLTLFLRTTPAMGAILIVHLACIAALFATAPYGKFVHAVYRALAIARYQMEQTQAHPSGGH